MKKLLYLALFPLLLLSGCEKKPAETAPASLFVMEGDATAAGVRPGDGPEEFQKAYSGYTLQVAWNDVDSNYIVMSPEDIPSQEDISTLIATLFIDGNPATERQVCEEHSVSSNDLHTLLSSAKFLRAHEVIYRYLDFDWKDGQIAHIASEELNYNETFEVPCQK